MKTPSITHRFETRLIHAGEPLPRIGQSVTLPIFQTSTFEYENLEAGYADIKYTRLSNTPNHLALHRKLASLEGGEDALVTSSGMSAVAGTLLSLLGAGDHLLIQSSLYGGTHQLVVRELARLGITFDFIDPQAPATWAALRKPHTKVIYAESLSNPLLRVPDFAAIVKFAREHRLVSVIDNTFPSPVGFRPLEHGFDISLHSATKYLGGHSDLIAGAIIGSRALIAQAHTRINIFGASLDPNSCFLLDRGIKTLALRFRHQSQSADQIARHLEKHPAVEHVYYPSLASHPDHARARELFDGFGGVLSLRLKGKKPAALRLLSRLTLPVHAPSLGGVESLVTLPSLSTHSLLTAEERERTGVTDDLVRLAIGIESPEDLIDDLDQALEGAV